jgi:hypothetical protein
MGHLSHVIPLAVMYLRALMLLSIALTMDVASLRNWTHLTVCLGFSKRSSLTEADQPKLQKIESLLIQ